MKKVYISFAVLIICLISADLFAYSSRKKYFSRPQFGVWFGPITPVGSTYNYVDTGLGGGAFFRYNLPYQNFKVGLEVASEPYDSEKNLNEIKLVPLYGNILYLLPLRLPLRIQLKGGLGGCRIHAEPDGVTQWDPLVTAGTEISFPAGKLLNVALRLDYLMLYEGFVSGAKENGHFFNAGISLYLNLNL